ncbi:MULTISPECIES: glycosyltransferase [Desulfovibrio]|uniref:Glycosyl transferases group 1 n=2 Tax=Desulfovibrio TaxID=872 RepID=A0AA94HUH6_DESDE|nr:MULTISPECIES: glycosyltransferase [Desulfovibrio]SFW66840.1 Glycosyl transferases group 1 [Desulfovibrio desulfuricans]SPD34261.1 S-adenosyl-L-methionine-dependent methyltransferase [Desulfovibrio sp. G11]
MKLLYLSIKQTTALAQGRLISEMEELIAQYFPGSVLYGPGYPGYHTADVPEILETYGGENNFDAIFCALPERELAGDPLGLQLSLKYVLPSHLWHFPLNLHKTKLPKILACGDFWHLSPQDWNRVLLSNNFCLYISAFLSPFITPEAMRYYFPPTVQEKVIFMPIGSYASENIYIPGLPKQHDILLAGANVPEFYPVRSQMAQAFQQSGLSLCVPHHPGYSLLKTVSPPSSYVQDLAQSRISAFCSSQFHFMPLKLFEAMASCTVALCDNICGVEHLGMEPDKHFILADSSNCVEKAQHWLEHPDLYKETTEAAYALFRSRHTVSIRMRELAEQIPPILNGGHAHGWIDLSPNFQLVRALSRSAPPRNDQKSRIIKKDWWDMATAIQKETWHYWYQLFPLQYPDAITLETVRLPNYWSLRTAALGHLEAFKAQLLLNIIQQNNLHSFLEVGTGMGYYSILWADYLRRNNKRGIVFAEDSLPGRGLTKVMSPQYLQMDVTRDLLWAGIPAARDIHFLLRRDGWHSPLARKKLDLLFFNTSPNLQKDFEKLSSSVGPQSILAVNSYGSAYPKIMDAVEYMAKALNKDILQIDFGPYDSGLALLLSSPAMDTIIKA